MQCVGVAADEGVVDDRVRAGGHGFAEAPAFAGTRVDAHGPVRTADTRVRIADDRHERLTVGDRAHRAVAPLGRDDRVELLPAHRRRGDRPFRAGRHRIRRRQLTVDEVGVVGLRQPPPDDADDDQCDHAQQCDADDEIGRGVRPSRRRTGHRIPRWTHSWRAHSRRSGRWGRVHARVRVLPRRRGGSGECPGHHRRMRGLARRRRLVGPGRAGTTFERRPRMRHHPSQAQFTIAGLSFAQTNPVSQPACAAGTSARLRVSYRTSTHVQSATHSTPTIQPDTTSVVQCTAS